MSTTLWIVIGIVVGAVVLIPLTITLVLGYFVASKSRSRKMAEEQASLNKKTGASDETPATTTPGRSGDNDKKWYVKYTWSIVLAVIGAGIFWKLYKPGLRFSQLGDWSWENWLWLLAFWGILIALIALNKVSLGTWEKTLQSTVAVAMFLMFLGVPAGLWVRDVFLPAVVCPDASAHETRSCLLNVAWSAPLKPSPKEDDLEGKRLCTLSGNDDVEFKYVVNSGGSYWLFRAKKGTVLMTYRLMDVCQTGRRL